MDGFRQATEADLSDIVAMMRHYYSEDQYAFVESEAIDALLDLIHDNSLGRLWVLERDDRVVGYLAVTLGFSLEYRGRDAFIDELFIEPGSRGLGLGKRALEIAEIYCREQGVKALHLEVERHRQSAFELYRRAGFKDHDRYLMTKWLDKDSAAGGGSA